MLNYQRTIPTKLYFGEGQISHLSKCISEFGKKVLLTYGGGSIKKIGLYNQVIDILKQTGCEIFELSDIEPNPRIESVEKGVQICRDNCIDVILAVGGGSTIDCSKAIAVGTYYNGTDMWEMVLNQSQLSDKAVPLVTILTISATGSEYDGGGVISNMHTNQKLGRSFTYPAYSICDPSYTYSVSPYQTAAGSADIMSHIFEEYFSRIDDSDVSEGLSETIIKSVMSNCPIAIKDPTNYSARANLMTASSLACSGIPVYGKIGSGWACHAMEHELSAQYDVTHGVGVAIITPRWMRYILQKDPSTTYRFAKLGRNAMGLTGIDESKLAKETIDTLEDYFKSTGIPMSLSELGIGDEKFLKMAEQANIGNCLKDAYVPLTTEDVVNIFKSCL